MTNFKYLYQLILMLHHPVKVRLTLKITRSISQFKIDLFALPACTRTTLEHTNIIWIAFRKLFQERGKPPKL